MYCVVKYGCTVLLSTGVLCCYFWGEFSVSLCCYRRRWRGTETRGTEAKGHRDVLRLRHGGRRTGGAVNAPQYDKANHQVALYASSRWGEQALNNWIASQTLHGTCTLLLSRCWWDRIHGLRMWLNCFILKWLVLLPSLVPRESASRW